MRHRYASAVSGIASSVGPLPLSKVEQEDLKWRDEETPLSARRPSSRVLEVLVFGKEASSPV